VDREEESSMAITVPGRVAQFLKTDRKAYCDDCLGELLRLGSGGNRYMAHNATYSLAQTAEFKRQKGPCANCGKTHKLVTHAV
jgi:hypothetical protein